MATVSKVLVEFVVDKDTKNTIRYAEVDSGQGVAVGQLYVKKKTVEKLGNPQKLVVELRAV